MTELPSHINWLIDTKQSLKTNGGNDVTVFELEHTADDVILSEWAKHFRNHYCNDKYINDLISGTGKTKSEYLMEDRFPDAKNAPGLSIRSGDFAEILVTDYLEFILKYEVPTRGKYEHKDIRNESKKGVDVLGFRIVNSGSPLDDILNVCEVKAHFSGNKAEEKLQEAVNGSSKDEIRKAETLNASKQRFLYAGDYSAAKRIERFQNINDKPFTEKYCAVAVLDNAVFDESLIKQTNVSAHSNQSALSLIVIKGNNMLQLVRDLYERAANEA